MSHKKVLPRERNLYNCEGINYAKRYGGWEAEVKFRLKNATHGFGKYSEETT